MELYGYFRSSAAYRVRIGLNLKGLSYTQHCVHLVKDGGQQHSEDYKKINPAELVPALKTGSDTVITQSLAILEYLEDLEPTPSFFPESKIEKAKVRALAYDIACDVHPLNNLRVLQYIKGPFGKNDEEKMQWYFNWLEKGFNAYEKQLEKYSRQFSFGDNITLADICLIPQVYNANRFTFPMDKYPLINKVNDNCLKTSAFDKAIPENQPDAK